MSLLLDEEVELLIESVTPGELEVGDGLRLGQASLLFREEDDDEEDDEDDKGTPAPLPPPGMFEPLLDLK